MQKDDICLQQQVRAQRAAAEFAHVTMPCWFLPFLLPSFPALRFFTLLFAAFFR